MSTRADFYIGRTPSKMRWLGTLMQAGSVHPDDEYTKDGKPPHIMSVLRARVAKSIFAYEYELYVRQLIQQANIGLACWDDVGKQYTWLTDEGYGVFPEDGWPWSWPSSNKGTDLAYTFFDGKVWCSCLGGAWTPVSELAKEQWPDHNAKPRPRFPKFTPKVHEE